MNTYLSPLRRQGRRAERDELIARITDRYRRRWGVELAVDLGEWSRDQLEEFASGLSRHLGPDGVAPLDGHADNGGRNDLAQSA